MSLLKQALNQEHRPKGLGTQTNLKLTLERRIIADLNRADHHKEVPLFYFPVMEGPRVSEVNTIVSTLPTSQISLPLSVAMASVSMTQQMPTQATKSKTSKPKSKKPHSGISQKMPVSKSTKKRGECEGG